MSLGHGSSIVKTGLVVHLDAANSKSYKNYNVATYSQDFQNAIWTKSAGLVTATGILAPDGTFTATTLTDDLNNAWEKFNRVFTVGNDLSSYNISMFIKKTTGGTSTRTGFNVIFGGGAPIQYNIRFNADTGVATGTTLAIGALTGQTAAAAAFTATASITTGTSHWARFKIILENGNSTSLRLNITQSAGTVTPRRGSYWKATRLTSTNVGTYSA